MRRPRFALVLLLLLAACTTPTPEGVTIEGEGPIAPSFAPIEMPHPDGAARELTEESRPLPMSEAGFREKWELASRYVAAGFDTEAIQVIDAALRQDPPDTWRERLRGLKTTLRMRKTEISLVRVEVKPTRDYVLFGQPVDIEIRVHNVADVPIALLPPDTGDVSPTAISLELSRVDREVSANQLRRTWTQTLYVRRADGLPVRIPAGGVYRQRARIPAEDVGAAIAGYRVLHIDGRMRTTRFQIGDQIRPVHTPIRPGRVLVLPSGFEPLAADPVQSMTRAAETLAPVHLLVASEFVPRADRMAAIQVLSNALETGHAALRRPVVSALQVLRERSAGEPIVEVARPLMDALERKPSRRQALMEGLAALTGAQVAPDLRLWRVWWQRVESARTPVRAATVRTAAG